VVGGGFAGTAVAKGLDNVCQVVLVEPRDAFMYNIAALRALVDPTWLPRIFFPYDKLLSNGRVVQDRVVLAENDRVVTAAGEEIEADYIVLATGSRYPFPAKTDLIVGELARQQVRTAHQALIDAQRVLLIGAGPVGIELAGEMGHRWPDKSIVLLDAVDEVLGGPYNPLLKAELRRQLEALNIELRLGSPLRQMPPTHPGELATFTVTTEDGNEITADIWFRCHGIAPNSDYLSETLASARRPDGFVDVTASLQVVGQQTVFALGDLSTADAKIAGFALQQAEIVIHNVSTLIQGGRDLAAYQPSGVGILIPMGPTGGAGQFPGEEGIVGPDTVSEIKGRDMNVDLFVEFFGLTDRVAD
jgi:apoptosis-inducing factor 2